MKRGKYDNEYAKVKDGAEPKRPPPYVKPKIIEEEVYHSPDESARVQKMADEFKKHVAASTAKERAEASARTTEYTLQVNKRMSAAEWQSAGVKCPWLDADGMPKYSLSFVLLMGWRFAVDADGDKVLIGPKQEAPRPRETRTNEMGS